MPRLIGIAGKMGSGKDAVAAMLSMVGYGRHAFADPLKKEVTIALREGSLPPTFPILLRIAYNLGLLRAGQVYRKPTRFFMRWTLQWWGTEFRRSQDRDYWIKELFAHTDLRKLTAFPDARFANEAAAIRSRGGEVWLVVGKQRSPRRFRLWRSNHASESLSGILPDRIIENDGSLLDLAVKVREALNSGKVTAQRGKAEMPRLFEDENVPPAERDLQSSLRRQEDQTGSQAAVAGAGASTQG